MNRLRPRFSVRTLAIFVTLVCCYFASWPLTEKYGVPKTTIYNDYAGGDVIWGGSSPAPFIILQDEIVLPPYFVAPGKSPISIWSFRNQTRKRRYYFWLFGLKLRLPYESDWEHVTIYRDFLPNSQIAGRASECARPAQPVWV